MTANYSEALEQQFLQQRMWAGPYGHDRVFGSRSTGAIRAFFPRPEHAQNIMVDTLTAAETYFVSAELCDSLMSAADRLPSETTMQSELLPSPLGWIWLERPIRFPGDLNFWGDEHGCDWSMLRAISWAVGLRAPNGRVYVEPYGLDPADTPVNIGLFGYMTCSHRGSSPPELISLDTWEFGDSIDNLIALEDAEQTGIKSAPALIRRFLTSIALFVAQKVMVPERQLAERHTRRRLERDGWSGGASVHVVQLRRAANHSNKQHGQETTWACQWFVRGHWRQQPYPKAGDVRPKWITPYVKGPEDKPLKPPRATVFAVVR